MMVRIAQLTRPRLHGTEAGTLLSEDMTLIFSLRIDAARAKRSRLVRDLAERRSARVPVVLDHGFDLVARQSDVAKLMIVEFAQHLDGFAPRPKGQHAAHASGEPPAPFTCRAGAGAGKCHGRSPRHWPARGKAVPWREAATSALRTLRHLGPLWPSSVHHGA